MNAHSVGPRLSSESPAKLIDQCLIERIANTRVNDLHHLLAIDRGADRIDVQVKMRRDDAEFEKDGAIGVRDIEQRFFDAVMDGGKMRVLVRRQIGHVLDVLLPDDHRVSTHCPIVVQDDEELIVFEDQFAGIAGLVAENAGHERDDFTAREDAKTRRKTETASRLRAFA